MAELNQKQLQARAVNNLDDAMDERQGREHQQLFMARAQVHATLAVAAALKDLAEAVRAGR